MKLNIYLKCTKLFISETTLFLMLVFNGDRDDRNQVVI